jgi:hypothetical protein
LNEAATTVAVTDRDRLSARLDAVERTLAGREDDADPGGDDDPGSAALAERLDDVEARVAEVEAGLQAVRGYVGGVEAVNDDVERRADAALATADRALAAVEGRPPGDSPAGGDGTHDPGEAAVDIADGTTNDGTPATENGDERSDDPDDAAPWPVRRLRGAL